MNRRSTGLVLALVAAVISGGNIFVNGLAVASFHDPTLYTTAKNLVAAVLLIVLLGLSGAIGARHEGWTRPRTAAQWPGLAAVGVIGGSIPFVLFFEGLARASASDAAFIQKTLVVWVALIAVVVLRERIGVAHVAAIALLIAGQALLQSGLTKVAVGPGELMIFAATLLWAVELVIAKRLLATLSALTVSAARMTVGVIVLLGYSIASGHVASLSAPQLIWVVVTGALLALYVGTWYSAVARAPVVDVTAVLTVGAVVTAGLNAAVRGVPIAPQLEGLTLIVLGTLLVVLLARRTSTGSYVLGAIRQ